MKLSNNGSQILWSTFIGSRGYDFIDQLCIDASGNIIAAGQTGGPGFPTTPGAYNTSDSGPYFVLALNASGDRLLWSTSIPTYNESGAYIHGMAIDDGGDVYLSGEAVNLQAPPELPTTPGAFRETASSYREAYVLKLADTGKMLAYCTFLGGSGMELLPTGSAITTDTAGALGGGILT